MKRNALTELHARQRVEIVIVVLWDSHAKLLPALDQLATAQLKGGKSNQAIATLERQLELAIALSGPDDDNVTRVRRRIVRISGQ